MSAGGGADSLSPPEERLLAYLQSLRDDAPEPPVPLAATVIRSAGWQAAIRPFALTAGVLIGGMGESVRIMAGRVAR
ncbi:MAG TPA: hypothetical protein VE570_06320 [Thermoleophilaceae bacterium]|nr:hypothetical protein [Thermoleophilaceae bacterium]